jgi:hypothetical protein
MVDTPLAAPIKCGNLQIYQMHIEPQVRYKAYGVIPGIERLARDKLNLQSRVALLVLLFLTKGIYLYRYYSVILFKNSTLTAPALSTLIELDGPSSRFLSAL